MKDGGPAFPVTYQHVGSNGEPEVASRLEGMSLLDYFAAKTMHASIASDVYGCKSYKAIATDAGRAGAEVNILKFMEQIDRDEQSPRVRRENKKHTNRRIRHIAKRDPENAPTKNKYRGYTK